MTFLFIILILVVVNVLMVFTLYCSKYYICHLQQIDDKKLPPLKNDFRKIILFMLWVLLAVFLPLCMLGWLMNDFLILKDVAWLRLILFSNWIIPTLVFGIITAMFRNSDKRLKRKNEPGKF